MILAFNCEKLLEAAYKKIPKEYFDEIYVMDDGSADHTAQIARQLGLKVFSHEKNLGYGANVKSGLKQAFKMNADYVVEIHGDGAQFNPQAISHAIPYLQKGVDFIVGSRFTKPSQAIKNGMPLPRFIANRILSFFDRMVLDLPLTEFHTGFLIYSKKFLNTVPFENNSNTHLFSFQVLAQAALFQLSVQEIPVEADYHAPHTSHSYWGASFYALGTFWILFLFLISKFNISKVKIFSNRTQPLT